ncbi:hypothetical protein B0T26DRAFT_799622 [Lasiosphaeria miniovina]|uniref:Uncharacterized protein n=1 Tax=Lasiosphaeria miniovina TaxID=1954250 RepID=A0AA40E7A0_9PEZI|nr:uncharacterized protein B0T26DRAFT_799622 [Lasiosphaeria miniovina]KAK0727672.1 hypothetical protein B0T26DRAFT_799622 [Lasiosphaeria miniovina]
MDRQPREHLLAAQILNYVAVQPNTLDKNSIEVIEDYLEHIPQAVLDKIAQQNEQQLGTRRRNQGNRTKGLKKAVEPITLDYNRPRTAVENNLVAIELYDLGLRWKITAAGFFNPEEEVADNEGSALVGNNIHYKDINIFL